MKSPDAATNQACRRPAGDTPCATCGFGGECEYAEGNAIGTADSGSATFGQAYDRAARFGWLPFRWSSVWCLVGLHNPVYSYDHDAHRPGLACWGCRRRLF